MFGNPNDPAKRGIIPRALEHVFEAAHHDKKNNYEIRIAYLQIYMEIVIINYPQQANKSKLQDLIEPSNTNVRIRESPENGVFITGNTWISVRSVVECLNVLSDAEKNRAFAFTKYLLSLYDKSSLLLV